MENYTQFHCITFAYVRSAYEKDKNKKKTANALSKEMFEMEISKSTKKKIKQKKHISSIELNMKNGEKKRNN